MQALAQQHSQHPSHHQTYKYNAIEKSLPTAAWSWFWLQLYLLFEFQLKLWLCLWHSSPLGFPWLSLTSLDGLCSGFVSSIAPLLTILSCHWLEFALTPGLIWLWYAWFSYCSASALVGNVEDALSTFLWQTKQCEFSKKSYHVVTFVCYVTPKSCLNVL